MLDVLLDQMLRFANTRFRLIASAVASSLSVSLITGSSFLSILLPGELFAPAFKKAGLAAKNLSRTTEDSGAIFVPLIPWSAAGVFMAATLGVPTPEYAPWAMLCYGGFIMALFYGYTGIGIAPRKSDNETEPGN
jgi:NhaC family Na+:H+ antiporter